MERLDSDAVRTAIGPQLHVGAGNVTMGCDRVYQKEELTPEANVASACPPMLFQAAEIEDPRTVPRAAHWDGGCTGSPALWPLDPAELAVDVVIVALNPSGRQDVPRDVLKIASRINDISFDATILDELRAVAFARRPMEGGRVERGAMKEVNLRTVGDDLMDDLNAATRNLPAPAMVSRLSRARRSALDGVLDRHRGDLGVRGPVDLGAMLA